MGITLKEIAVMAGVSRPAVSLVVKDPETKHVAPEKRLEILRLLKEHDYRPDYAARKLRGKSTRCIGMVGTLFSVPIHSIITDRVMKYFWKEGYQVMLADHGGKLTQVKTIVDDFKARGVDGLVLLDCCERKFLDLLDLPCVALTHNQEYYDISVDLFAGGLMAGRHLLEHGWKRAGFIGGTPQSGQLRRLGLETSMQEAGLASGSGFAVYYDDDPKSFAERICNCVRKNGVDAFFCMNDYLAAAAVRSLTLEGIRVSEEVGVIGFDGLSFGALTLPSLTTVVQPAAAMARRCVELMLERLQEGSAMLESPELFAPDLHIGESCGCRRSKDELLFCAQSNLLPVKRGISDS